MFTAEKHVNKYNFKICSCTKRVQYVIRSKEKKGQMYR